MMASGGFLAFLYATRLFFQVNYPIKGNEYINAGDACTQTDYNPNPNESFASPGATLLLG